MPLRKSVVILAVDDKLRQLLPAFRVLEDEALQNLQDRPASNSANESERALVAGTYHKVALDGCRHCSGLGLQHIRHASAQRADAAGSLQQKYTNTPAIGQTRNVGSAQCHLRC